MMIVFVSEFWIRLRKQEFVILRKNGMSKVNILSMMCKEVLVYSFIGSALGMIINLIAIYILNGYIDFNTKYIKGYFDIFVLYILLSVLIISSYLSARFIVGRVSEERG